jgi:hypothetical protein
VEEDVSVTHGEKHALFGEEDHYDYSDDLDEEMEELIDDEQGKSFLQNDTSLLEDRMDNGLEIFVKEEGPNQIKNLILEEHADNVMFGDISKYDEYEDWIRCVAEDMKKRIEFFFFM